MGFKLKRKNMKSKYVTTFNNKKYGFDLNKIREFCFYYTDSNIQNIECEITDVSTLEEEQEEMNLTQKVVRESKTNKSQNDVLMHDILKTFMFALLDNPGVSDTLMDFPTALAFNTLLEWGILKELE